MGFYKNCLKNVDEENVFKKEDISVHMDIIKNLAKAGLENKIVEKIDEYNNAISYPTSYFKITLGKNIDVRSTIDLESEIDGLIEQKEYLESQSTVEFFEDLFECEDFSLKQYTDKAFETMGECVEKTSKLSGNGFMATVYDVLGKKEELIKQNDELFEKCNKEAECSTDAQKEWEALSSLDKATVLVARFLRTGTTELNPEELDEYAKSDIIEEVNFGDNQDLDK